MITLRRVVRRLYAATLLIWTWVAVLDLMQGRIIAASFAIALVAGMAFTPVIVWAINRVRR